MLLLMAKFAYKNAKNARIVYMLFDLNCGYHICIFFEKDTNSRFQSKSSDEVSAELQDLKILCQKNLYHSQKLQKQAHNKSVKPKSYAPSDKVCLNKKYIKIKQN